MKLAPKTRITIASTGIVTAIAVIWIAHWFSSLFPSGHWVQFPIFSTTASIIVLAMLAVVVALIGETPE